MNTSPSLKKAVTPPSLTVARLKSRASEQFPLFCVYIPSVHLARAGPILSAKLDPKLTLTSNNVHPLLLQQPLLHSFKG